MKRKRRKLSFPPFEGKLALEDGAPAPPPPQVDVKILALSLASIAKPEGITSK